MARENASCPYCGKATMVTVPTGKKLKYVRQNMTGSGTRSAASCEECGATFHAYSE